MSVGSEECSGILCVILSPAGRCLGSVQRLSGGSCVVVAKNLGFLIYFWLFENMYCWNLLCELLLGTGEQEFRQSISVATFLPSWIVLPMFLPLLEDLNRAIEQGT